MTSDARDLQTTSRYIIPAISSEKERLAKQYAMKKAIYGWSSAVPTTIDLSKVENVLDIAAGTCIWTLDFADMPQVKSNRDKINIYACDINTDFFPDSRFMDDMGITTFGQDVTAPFAEEYHGKFDLIHASFLVICLTEEGWLSALANFAKILKPGGIVLMDESDPIFFTEEQPPWPIDAGGHVIDKCMDGTSWVHKANCVYTGYSLKNGFVVGLTICLRGMLEQAGFVVEDSQRGLAAVGKVCRSRKGLDGGSLAAYEDFSVENMDLLLPHLAAGMFEKQTLEVPPGNIVTEKMVMDEILNEVQTGMRADGAILVGAYFVARKS
ncbi:hypothetical protein B0H16DRAFT_1580772 [Mycena metata]|uniref:Methyltransferase domain-containing protein n=1 Tax=Mycena metata TaxID=1033252 RepID=A0AAD7I167_9AGAR|nr:hypothetical protein B0H16DRAFT_1580772 [Mycena metata]